MKRIINHPFHLFFPCILLILGFLSLARSADFASVPAHGGVLTDAEALYIKQRQLLYYRDEFGDRGENVTVDPDLVFRNARLRNAYIALQAWKEAILSDPYNLTENWVGSDVCNYTGVFCAPALDDPKIETVAGIDLNHGDIAGYLPEELGLLVDLALFHINSNRFCGTVPRKFKNLVLLFELDLSNNRFAGKFPAVVLQLPSLKFLDLRFNEFEGKVPRELFDKPLDAIFINHNRFVFELPDNFGNSPVSVIVLAHNKFHGCLPASIGNMSDTLNELIMMDNELRSCVPEEIGLLKNLTVLDVSYNELMGPLPESIGGMLNLEQLNVAHNMLTGSIPESVCSLPDLQNFTFSYNFFTGEPPVCLSLEDFDDRRNCLANRPLQRSAAQCKTFASRPVHCSAFRCKPFVPTLPPPPPPSPPPPPPPILSPPPPPSTHRLLHNIRLHRHRPLHVLNHLHPLLHLVWNHPHPLPRLPVKNILLHPHHRLQHRLFTTNHHHPLHLIRQNITITHRHQHQYMKGHYHQSMGCHTHLLRHHLSIDSLENFRLTICPNSETAYTYTIFTSHSFFYFFFYVVILYHFSFLYHQFKE
uniref:Cell wall hydroxyproline-rich glycoprotein n=1 Tax=Kalanchoe fedtschenkoi TaxID=63787 RepID=A0A7N0T7G7_KALFE